MIMYRLYDRELLLKLQKKARESKRKRVAHSFSKPEDKVQVMLNAIEPESYVRPHRHGNPRKVEIIQAVCGRIAAVSFDDSGRVLKKEVTEADTCGNVILIPAGTWHSMVSLESGSVMLEIIEGPYDAKTHKLFAVWAPEEGTDEAGWFLSKLKNRMKYE